MFDRWRPIAEEQISCKCNDSYLSVEQYNIFAWQVSTWLENIDGNANTKENMYWYIIHRVTS